MAMRYNSQIVNEGLVLCLDAANPKSYVGSGTNWNDLTKNNNTASFVNGPVFSSVYGGGIVRDSTDDFIQGDIKNITTTTSFTVETVFKANPAGSYRGIVSAWNSGNPGAGGWEFQFSNSSIGVHPTYTVSYTTNEIVHIVYTQSGTTVNLYKNGVLGQTSSATVDLRNGKIGIGNLSQSGYPAYNLDSTFYFVRIYNRVLSQSDILQNYSATKGRFGLK